MLDATDTATSIWWHNPAQAPGFSYEHPVYGIMLDGIMFEDPTGTDTWKDNRLHDVTHELAHRTYNLGDQDMHQTGRAVGPPYAEDVAQYCTRQSDVDPLTGMVSGGGGSGGGSGSGNQVCTEIFVDYYLYDPNTATLTYLRTESLGVYCYTKQT